MHKYELTLIVSLLPDDESVKAEFERVKETIARFGGTVDKVDEWGRRRLSYEIKKQAEGHYYFVTFDGMPNTPNELEAFLRIDEKVLRYLIVRLDPKK